MSRNIDYLQDLEFFQPRSQGLCGKMRDSGNEVGIFHMVISHHKYVEENLKIELRFTNAKDIVKEQGWS